MGDLISRGALKKAIAEFHQEENERLHTPLWGSIGLNALDNIIDNAPPVPLPDFKEGYKQAIRDGKTNISRPQGEWIPIKKRPLTEEEKEEYPDSDFMYDCQLPDDGEEVLITTSSGYVDLDTFCRDDGCYFGSYCDKGDVIAWQPKPKPYKEDEHGC